MKRWGPAFLLALVGAFFVMGYRFTGAYLMTDSDTAVILQNIQSRGSALSWFASDWPLGNHFYRPITALTFELNHALSGLDPVGYGWTNALLVLGCILVVFWLAHELTERPWFAALSSLIFAFWFVPIQFNEMILVGLGVVALLVGLIRQRSVWPPLASVSIFVLALVCLGPIAELGQRTLTWVPGRTASLMTLFGLISLASFARSIRLRGLRLDPAPAQATDIPASKSSVQLPPQPRAAALWLGVSIVSLLLALGSYEQAVMLPFLLIGVQLLMKRRGFGSPWALHGWFWGSLAVYLLMRTLAVSSDPSAYQAQQFRSGLGWFVSLSKYAFPGYLHAQSVVTNLSEAGPLVLILLDFWRSILVVAGNAVAFVRAHQQRLGPVLIFGYVGSAVAYLPMMLFKPFEHYHVLPLAIRSLMVASLLLWGLESLLSAVSPRVRQAPTRLDPAPGSLLRPSS